MTDVKTTVAPFFVFSVLIVVLDATCVVRDSLVAVYALVYTRNCKHFE